MKKLFYFIVFSFVMVTFQQCAAQKPENWTTDELIEPSVLAQQIKENKNLPLIYCVGPGVVIPHSIDIGMTSEEDNLNKFKEALEKLPRDTNMVIYCGCCPFNHCPNVRPAIALLKEMKFSNFHLLNLPDNIRKDWIEKGYPQVAGK